jgi:hypothetical protein
MPPSWVDGISQEKYAISQQKRGISLQKCSVPDWEPFASAQNRFRSEQN